MDTEYRLEILIPPVSLPTIIASNGPAAPERFLEFGSVNIRNPNTHRAYARYVTLGCLPKRSLILWLLVVPLIVHCILRSAKTFYFWTQRCLRTVYGGDIFAFSLTMVAAYPQFFPTDGFDRIKFTDVKKGVLEVDL